MTGEVEVVRETIPEGSEKEPTTGDKGSTWKTWLHIRKDGEEVSRDVYHTTHYKGHTEYYFETEPTEESETETESYPEEFGPGYTGPGTPALPSAETNPSEDPDPTGASSPDGNRPADPDGPNQPDSPRNPSDSTPGIHETPGGIPGSGGQPGDGPSIIQDGP